MATPSTRPLPAILLSWLIPLTGCGAANFLSSLISPPDLSGNWQFQSAAGASTTAPPTAGLLLLGALHSQGAQVTGTFRLANLSVPNSCGLPLQQIITLTGTIDSTRNLTLSSAPFSGSTLTVSMTVPPVLTGFGAGTIAITGGACTFPSSPAIAAEIVPVTGTYAGPVTASTTIGNPPIPGGTATLTLAQSATAATDGQFPVTGTLQFTGGTCNRSEAISGTVSGSELTLASLPIPPLNLSQDQIVAFVLPTATQLPTFNILYGLGPCGTGITAFSSYSGALTRQ